MKITVVTPIGPGHMKYLPDAIKSVETAWLTDRGPFDELEFHSVDDSRGTMGRSAARNQGLRMPSDWYFLLDADDCMMPNAFGLVDLTKDATFGTVFLDGIRSKSDRYPCKPATIFRRGARGTLCMGFFLRGGLDLWFDESLDKGEDFDFYMRIPSWRKINQPLVDIGYRKPSAGGPRGYGRINWINECDAVIEKYRRTHAEAS